MFLYAEKRLEQTGMAFGADFGHPVRLATHVNFSTFVKSAGIDFYLFGGDPWVLAGCLHCNYRYGQEQRFNSICTRRNIYTEKATKGHYRISFTGMH
ncbi:Sterol 3-beta-glucosyltransferase UGT80A2 [Camellia lanceoleosa]|uniref:Sterol 3-beta-glucosyltransferase UGT80A2 n=1 Tax=Camellia lanceoleosa TaxID=1840588 RepID=A0ACC0HWN1_9ERIC|nr:Sterol 3-beta-glucosyltransferase UGT80A2 [Camellia lanceoleosa]